MNSSITVSNVHIQREQLYNCDETSLNFKIMPSKILITCKEKSAPAYKRSEE
jgi:hypothetical protein